MPPSRTGAGARLQYLPPYVPDFNQTGNLWSKVMQVVNSQESRIACQLLKAAGAASPRSHRPNATDSCYGLDTLSD